MDHKLVKDIIEKQHKESAPKQASVFIMEQTENFVLNAPETMDYEIKKILHLQPFKECCEFPRLQISNTKISLC